VGGETLRRSRAVLTPGGRLVTIAAEAEGTSTEPRDAAFFIVEANRTQLGELASLIDAGRIRPVIDAVFPLAQARQAYEHRPRRGKAVLRVVDPA
jgi:NADPH:quinone reductase-like Zn-dependent oxidoreductase